MRKLLLPLLLLLLVFSANAQPTQKIYYYYKGQKVFYPVSFDRIAVGIKPGDSFGNLKKTIASLLAVSEDSLQETLTGKQFLVKLGHNKVNDIAPYISKLKQNATVTFAKPVFISSSGNYNSYGDEFIVDLKSSTSFTSVQSLLQKTGCRLVRQYPFEKDMYILAAGAQADYDGLAMANQFYETGLFDYAEPNKYVYNALHVAPNDPLYNLQWAHNNTGSAAQYNGTPGADLKVQQAWDITMGSASIKIGVIDEGVDLTHPDLQANLLQGFNGGTMTSNPGDGAPTYAGGAHGTNCAGIIAAIANNGIGIAGVAPNCKIIPAVIFGGSNGDYLGDAAVAASFDYVRINGADVISNSWGGGPVSSAIDAAIHRAVTLGRAGKGCVVLFSSGNNNNVVSYPGNNLEVISVGGINMCNQRKTPSSCDGEYWWGANYGTGLDVVAPCVKIASTDIQGTGGYNTAAGTAGDYYNIFNGTSSACPNAAGVVALILSVSPSLTVAQAIQLLEASCDKIPGYSFAANAAQPNGTWNNELGHGRVNAAAAVQLAISTICPNPTISNAAVTQPVCPSPEFGTIVVTASGNGVLEYSLNGGAYQLSNTFSGLVAGSYLLTARVQGGDPNCIGFYSGNPVIINQAASTIVFAAPTVIQPSCAGPAMGTIIVNATGSGTLEYSLNGGPYQLSNSFSGLAPASYNIRARLQGTTTCTQAYAVNPVVIYPANTAVSTVSYTGPAVAIPDGNATGVNIPLTVSGAGFILTDLNFRLDANPAGTCDGVAGNTNAAVSHAWIGDLVFKLTSPQGTTVTLIDRIGDPAVLYGNSGKNFCNVTLDDDGGYSPIENVTTAPIAGNFSPNNPLSAFDGENPNGVWTLNISDRATPDAGTLRRFSLIINAGAPCPGPTSSVLTVNGASTICRGTSANLVVAVTSGVPPYTVVYSDGTNNFTIPNYISGADIPVSPTANTTYSLVSVADAFATAGTGNSGTATVTVTDPPTWYLDADGDGHYVSTVASCLSPGAGYNNTGGTLGDCDDDNINVWQSALLYVDGDGDGYDAGQETVCYGATTPTGYSLTTSGTDCDDTNPSAQTVQTWYLDADGDTHYVSSMPSCGTPGTGYNTTGGTLGDCDDNDNTKWQSALLYIDGDGDGYDAGQTTVCYGAIVPTGFSLTSGGTDCNDANANIKPGAAEICGNGIDDNCNGAIDENCNACQNAISFSTTNISSTSAQLNWVASVDPVQWQVQYKTTKQGAKWIDVFVSGDKRSVTISPLLVNQNYNWHIRAKCGKNWTPYSVAISFKTLASVPLVSSRQAATTIDEGKAIQLYPNPARGQFKLLVRLTKSINANAKIELFSTSGQAVFTSSGFVSNGVLQTTIQVPITVASGMYVVKVTTANEVQQAKLVYSKN